MWRNQTRPIALATLWALGALLATLLAVQCGCGFQQTPAVFTTTQEYDAAVHIEATCVDVKSGELSGWYGSGVVITDRIVLTAAHLSRLPEGKICSWEGSTRNGILFQLTPMVTDVPDDLASMRSDRVMYAPHAVLGEVPSLGDRVCDATAHQRRQHHCGEIMLPYVGSDESGLQKTMGIETTIQVDAGNSGSGVYDMRGKLIGIVSKVAFCTNGQMCTSVIEYLDGHIVMLMGAP